MHIPFYIYLARAWLVLTLTSGPLRGADDAEGPISFDPKPETSETEKTFHVPESSAGFLGFSLLLLLFMRRDRDRRRSTSARL